MEPKWTYGIQFVVYCIGSMEIRNKIRLGCCRYTIDALSILSVLRAVKLFFCRNGKVDLVIYTGFYSSLHG